MNIKRIVASNIIILQLFSLLAIFSNGSCSQGQRNNNEQQNNSRIETSEKAKELVKERASLYDLGVDLIDCQEITDNTYYVWGAGWEKRSGDRISFTASVTKDGEIGFHFKWD